MDVSIVIPCRNGARTLARQLDSLVAQVTTARFEVLVADNGSTDGSADVVGRYPDERVRLVDASARLGANFARNRGVAAASPGIGLILFCDADDVVRPGWIEAYWRVYRSGGRLMAGSLCRVPAPGGEGSWQRYLSNSLGFLPWAAGANCAVAVEVLRRVGGFDEAYRYGGDDTDFFWRAQLAGYELVHVDAAEVDYVMRNRTKGVYRQRRAYGVSHVQLFATFGAHGMPRLRGGLLRHRLGAAARASLAQRSPVPLAGEWAIVAGHVRGSVRYRTFFL